MWVQEYTGPIYTRTDTRTDPRTHAGMVTPSNQGSGDTGGTITA